MRETHEALGLNTPVVAHNGAVVVDLMRHRVLHHAPVRLEVARRVLEIIQHYQPDANLHVETPQGGSDAWHVQRLDERVKLFVEKFGVMPPDSVGEIQKLLRDETVLISKLWFRAPTDTMAAIKQHLLDELAVDIGTLAFDDVSLTILATGVTKATALAWVGDRLGVRQDEVVFIGDEINDIPLLGWAGLGIAMGNALQEVKAIAQVVTLSNAQDGVAHAVYKHVLNSDSQHPSL